MSRRDTFAGRNIDWMTLVLTLALMLVGLLMIYAVNYDAQHLERNSFFKGDVGKQAFFVGISIFIFFITYIIESKFWQTFAYLIYAFGIILLLGLFVFGHEIKGSTSWYRVFSFTFQPSEIAKFATSIGLAAYLSRFNTDIRQFRTQLTTFGLILLPAVLIVMQGDPGSALVFSAFLIVLYRQGLSANFYIISGVSITLLLLGLIYPPLSITLGLILVSIFALILNLKNKLYLLIAFSIWLAITLFASSKGLFIYAFVINFIVFIGFAGYTWLDKKRALISRLCALLAIGFVMVFSSNFTFNSILKPHQQDRINAWLQPSKTDELYNVVQSKLAIGSGGFYGKGYLEGTMTMLDFVPEQSTDFIFSTIGEEQGFVGSIGILGIIFLLIYRITVLAERQRSEFSRNYAYGIAGILFVHCFVNIGMTMGLVPVVGIPLPFISYGGSSILAFSVMIGVLLKLDSKRFSG